MPPPRKRPKIPLDARGYGPGYIEPAPSRTLGRPPRAVLRIYGANIALGYPWPETRAEIERAIKDARAIRREIEDGKRPDPRKRMQGNMQAAMRSALAPSAMTFATSQAQFIRSRVALSPQHENDPIRVRRHRIKLTQYRVAFRAVFPEDDYLTDATVMACVDEWLRHPVGVVKNVKDETGIIRRMQEPVTRKSAANIRSRISVYLRYCHAKRWITINPFDGDAEMIVSKATTPKLKALTRQQRRAVLREVAKFARTWKTTTFRWRRSDRLQLTDFVRILGLSGMRLGEAASLRLVEHVTDTTRENYVTADTIVLADTKTTLLDSDTLQIPRMIPLVYFPLLSALIDRQRVAASARNGYLFAWHDIDRAYRVSQKIKECFRSAGISVRLDPAHIWRSIASHYYLHDLQLPLNVTTRLLGHSERVNAQNYTEQAELTRRALADLHAALSRHLPRAIREQ